MPEANVPPHMRESYVRYKKAYDRKYRVQHQHPCLGCGKLVGQKRLRCISCANKTIPRPPINGDKNPAWSGGRIRTAAGYVRIYTPKHPGADAQGYVLEHRLVMEAHLGRVLLPAEVVHHINGDVADNRIENLALFSSLSAHVRHHHQGRRNARQ